MALHTLGRGETVVLVAEKPVAIQVVYKLLEKLSLGGHCLYLSSASTGVKDILRQITAVVLPHAEANPADAGTPEAVFFTQSAELDGRVRDLHRERKAELSLYDAYDALDALRAVPEVALPAELLHSLEAAMLERLAGAGAGGGSPWNPCLPIRSSGSADEV